ncbi:MAG: LamG-like jellyroll fold domain-containing protein [Bacteroidota bacterium]
MDIKTDFNFYFMKKRSPYYSTLVGRCKQYFLIAVAICFGFSNVSIAQRFVHPGIPFTQYDLDQLKANITQEPWLSAYNTFKNDNHSKLTYGQQGPVVSVSRAPNLNNTKWQQDMIAIHHLAFMWVFTGDSAYARKATDMLDAWAVINTSWGGGESMLDIGDYADYWATGADILRGTFPNWTAANTQHVKNYFANVLYPTSFVPYQLRDANKGAIQLKIALGVAAFNDDATKFNEAIDVYRMDAGGGMRNSLTNGETGDAGRDDHWRVQVAALAWGAEVAYKQGVDMYAELDNRMLAIGELYHKYAFIGNTLTYIPMGGYSSFWTNWGIAPGARRGDYTNILKAAYSLRKAIPTPYTDTMRAALGGAGGDFLFLKTSDTSTALPLSPVYYPADNAQPVSLLTNLDIGNPGIAGSATYNSGTWTLKAAGNSLSNSMNYTFKKIKGDAGLVVKVTGMSLPSSGSGVMIRQSLAAGSAYWSVQLGGAGGVGPHYQPKAPWWLKIERVGNRIFTYHSPDGINWTGVGCSYSPSPRPDSLYYGLYTISNNTTVLNTATFTDVAFSAAAPAGAAEITSATGADGIINTTFTYNTTATGNPTAYTATGLPDGLSINNITGAISGMPTTLGTYTVTLTATNASGTSTFILIIRVTNNVAPSAPAGATATVVNTSNIRLNWTAAANATTYSVKRSLSSGGPYTTIATGITATTYTDISPTPEVLNYYIITALAGALESGISNEASASVPPAIPVKPMVTLLNGQLKLDWDAAPGAATYNLKRSSVMGGPYTIIANVNGTTYTDAAVTNGNPYYYVISSVGVSLQSGNSPEAFGVPGAGAYTWAPSPLSENSSDAGNWLEMSTPASPAILAFKSTDDSTLNNDITNLNVSRILFDTDASKYTISGNSIIAGNDMVNVSANTQTLNTPFVLNNDYTINANTQNIVLGGAITGTGNLTRTGAGTVFIAGNNVYTGNTIVGGSAGTWPPTNAVAVAGIGTGTSGVPTAGPLGTGKIIMNGGALYSESGAATLYNDIEVTAGKTSRIFQTSFALNLYGKITGTGTLWQDGNTTAGLHLFGDNSGFSGTFVCALRSGNNRLRFEVPQSGSANAYWNLDANGVDCQSLQFSSGTISFGALTGRGFFRNNSGGTPIMSIGALNISTSFQGSLNFSLGVEKVGTANLIFTGNHTYTGPTTVRNGRFLVNNDPLIGTFVSPLTAVAGVFGGTGRTTGIVTIGTGAGMGATLEPGNLGIGTFTTTSTLTLLQDATYKVDINASTATADKILAGNVVLTNALLNPAITVNGSLPLGTNFTIIDNTASNAVAGTFNGLPELSLVSAGGYDFRVTYKGGTGNDVVLLDDRVVTITSALNDTILVGRTYSYNITTNKSPNSFTATGLPPGLNIDGATGLIAGTPTTAGTYSVSLSASDGSTTGSATLVLVVKSDIVDGLIVASGDAKTIVEWNSILNLRFNVKRSNVSGGPYTTIASNLTSPKFTDPGVTNGSVYYYVVSSVDGSLENVNSPQVTASPNAGQSGYYQFDEASGTRGVDGWGANHATLQAAATRNTGYAGQALSLNGTANSYATLPTGVVNGLSDFTVSAWVKMNTISTWMRVFDFGNSTTQYMFLSVQAALSGGNSTIRYAIKNGSAAEQNVNFAYPFPLNTWVHLAITQSGNTASLYINGTVRASNTGLNIKPAALGATTLNYLGKSQFSADPMYNGATDEFRIYSRALSAAEVNNIYAAVILPVTLINYTATLQNSGAVLLNWKTATEGNNSHYIVERSSDGMNFKQVGGLIAAGSASGAAYAFTDNNPLVGPNYYRLKQVDKDGKITDLGMRLIKVEGKARTWVVYPNPVKGREIYLRSKNTANYSFITATLYSSTGTRLFTKTFSHVGAGSVLTFKLDKNLPAGNYSMRLSTGETVPVVIVP